jgi:hypothetical protein
VKDHFYAVADGRAARVGRPFEGVWLRQCPVGVIAARKDHLPRVQATPRAAKRAGGDVQRVLIAGLQKEV